MSRKTGIFSISLIRGLFGMVVGAASGLLLVVLIRLLTGLPPWKPAPAWDTAAVFGTLGFIIATGVLRDWYRIAKGEEVPAEPEVDPNVKGWSKYLSVSYDHKVIGIQYGVTSLILFSLAGLYAMAFRVELAAPGMQYMSTNTYNTTMSLHGIVMIGATLLAVGAMSNFLTPLMIGANDMAFPRLNALAYWFNVPGAILLTSTWAFGGFDTGWTGYPPLSAKAPLGMDMFFLGVYFIGFSSILGSLNIVATIMRKRAPGMSYFRMPIFVWTAFATAMIAMTATQLIGLSFQMVLFERVFGMGFFDPNKGGNPILYQHLFWFYSHPAVYVFVLTGLGVISELLPVFTRKPLYGYRWVAISSFGIAAVGFLVWGHHMFTSGMAPYLRVPFMYSTLLVAVPTGVKFFSWVATLWEGKLSFETPMLFVLGAISIFLLGGLSGPPNGVVATDLNLQDTYWIVGHFHATLFGGFVFPFFAAIYYWYPKITGRMYNERLGKLHFWMMLPAFYVQSLGQMAAGLMGMRRRIADYDPALNVQGVQIAITIAGFIIATSVLISFVNFYLSARRGAVAVSNPWNSRAPEWQLPSPLPAHNYAEIPEVVGEPYDYGLEGSVYVNMHPSHAKPAIVPPPPTDQAAAAPAAAD